MSGRIQIDPEFYLTRDPLRRLGIVLTLMNHLEGSTCEECADRRGDRRGDLLYQEMLAMDAEHEKRNPNMGRFRARWRNARLALDRLARMGHR